MMTKQERIALLFLFLSALLWSLSGVFTKSVIWNGLCLAALRYFAQGALFMCANKYTTAARHGAVRGGLCSGHRHTADLQRGGYPEGRGARKKMTQPQAGAVTNHL